MDPELIAALAAAAEAIHASIETHNRLRDVHRRQAKRLYSALEVLRRECERQGVHLEITQTPGGHSEQPGTQPRR